MIMNYSFPPIDRGPPMRVTMVTDVELVILRNQLAIMRGDIRRLNGMIDAASNSDRDLLRRCIYETARILGMSEKEAL